MAAALADAIAGREPLALDDVTDSVDLPGPLPAAPEAASTDRPRGRGRWGLASVVAASFLVFAGAAVATVVLSGVHSAVPKPVGARIAQERSQKPEIRAVPTPRPSVTPALAVAASVERPVPPAARATRVRNRATPDPEKPKAETSWSNLDTM
jgi:hypothetical protein